MSQFIWAANSPEEKSSARGPSTTRFCVPTESQSHNRAHGLGCLIPGAALRITFQAMVPPQEAPLGIDKITGKPGNTPPGLEEFLVVALRDET